MFVDRVRIFAQAGDGGNGCISFRREKFVPRGGPDGGDGGRGGDVVLVADPQVDNLVAQYYQPIIRAKHGGNGMGKQMSGKSGASTLVHVPVGTLIFRLPDRQARPEEPIEDEMEDGAESGEQVSRRRKLDALLEGLSPIVDLSSPGQRFVLCQGGQGGRGNVHFKSSTNRVPRRATPGGEGEQGHFLLELRMIADVGLVGYPNAGKSSLLSAVSAAKPKVASYPFTTLRPNVGVVSLAGYRTLTVADVPGLIEGAHRDVGLGHDFLRHIVRCKVLAFVLDMAGTEGRHPADDYASLRKELDLYDPTLSTRSSLVVANKMDLPEANKLLLEFRQAFPKVEVVEVSTVTRTGLETVSAAWDRLVTGQSSQSLQSNA